ncbi:MAG: L,D-transpeptidase [Gammaproteobacteria bacterium]|nr:L,D-transpeptidase [Gammaproteobacteria bacterium]
MPDHPVELAVSLTRQILEVRQAGRVEQEFLVSTSRYGPGEQYGSLCTPRGRHVVRAMIGRGLPQGSVFRARRPTGEIFSPELLHAEPDRDWILSRILWLSGLEPGRNRFGNVDSMSRYIYIHGTPDHEPMGVPFSHGCIRMRNAEICRLFDTVAPGTPVNLLS